MKKIQIREFNYKQFFLDNKEIIKLQNGIIYPKIAFLGAVITTFALLASLFVEYMQRARVPYGIVCVGCVLLFFTRKSKYWKKHPTHCMYLIYSGIYLVLLFMSLVLFKDGVGASILVLFTIFPVSFVDRPEKLFCADIGMYVIHTVLSFVIKDPKYAGLDMVNGLIATSMGITFGFFILNSRLHALNFRMLWVKEREMDVLTSLYNRRKMTETLEGFARDIIEMPDGVVMMDIDWFKSYNDEFGHAAGDDCLKTFGQMLSESDWNANVRFYRYGGEEFICFIWDADKENIMRVAKEVHEKTRQLQMQHRPITISVGYVYCNDKRIKNFETWIQRADKALYIAKGRGRDCVVDFDEI